MSTEQRVDVLRLHRPRPQPPLPAPAAEAPQHVGLGRGLDPLGGDGEAERVGHGQHAARRSRVSPEVAPRPGSILSTSTSHCSRQRIDESPAPKASTATPTPIERMAATFSRAVGRSWSRAASVISRHRDVGSTPVAAMAASSSSTRPTSESWADDRLMRTVGGSSGRSAPHRAASAHARWITQSPMSTMRPESSAISMKRLGSEHLARRSAPSQQGLDRLDVAGRQVDLGLVPELELLTLEGAPEGLLDQQRAQPPRPGGRR